MCVSVYEHVYILEDFIHLYITPFFCYNYTRFLNFCRLNLLKICFVSYHATGQQKLVFAGVRILSIVRKVGKLTVITGPMYSGKTTELLNFAEIYEIGRKKTKIFKPKIDTRYSKEDVVTHKMFKMPATAVKDVLEIREIYNKLMEKPDAIFIDEVHFFDTSIKDFVKEIVSQGSDVYCAGLDLNYLWEPFETSALLMSLADEVIKKKAVCEVCGEYKGTLSFKNKANGNVIDVGGKEKYIAVCKDCYQKLKSGEGIK